MSRKLYEITEAFTQVEALLDSLTPEDLEKAEEFMGQLQISMRDKVHNIAVLIQDWHMKTDAIDDEVKRLQAMKKRILKAEKWLKDYLLFNMEKIGKDEIDTGIFIAKVKKNPAKIEVADEDQISEDYMKEKITYTVDKAKAKKEYNDTGILPAGFVITDSKRVEIK